MAENLGKEGFERVHLLPKDLPARAGCGTGMLALLAREEDGWDMLSSARH